jgi:hypothetical protein
MQRELTGAELALWPFVHGCLGLRGVLDDIRTKGLQPGSEANSFAYDRRLGRTRFVFLQPGRSRGGYGLGDVVVVDPGVLALTGVKGSLHDMGCVLGEAERLLETPEHELPEWILDSGRLRALVDEHRVAAVADSSRIPQKFRSLWALERAKKTLEEAAEFFDYAQGYLLPPTPFLTALARAYRDRGYSLDEFIDRGDMITTEEVLVPDEIPPSSLLGYRLDGHWRRWREPETREVATRLDELVGRWNAAKD